MINKRVGLYGYYGMRNFGDDLFVYVATRGLKHYVDSIEVSVIGTKVQGVDAEFITPNILNNTYSSRGMSGKFLRLALLLYTGLRADRIVFAGGSLFNSGGFNAFDSFLKVYGKSCKYAALGVSVGPFKTNKDYLAVMKRLSFFDFISTRDKKSYERLLEMNLSAKVLESSDIVGALPLLIKHKVKAITHKEKNIGFSPCNIINNPELGVSYCDKFFEAIKLMHMGGENICITIISLNDHSEVGDRELVRYISNKIASLEISFQVINYADIGVAGTWDLISGLDFYCSVRLHGAITAFLNNIPFYLFEYHEKCTEFLIDSIGKAHAEELTANNLAELILKGLVSPPDRSVEIDRFSHKSLLSFTGYKQFLSG